MNNQVKVLDLLNQKQNKQVELESLVYGSIEVREKDNKKYIYTHTKKKEFNQQNILVSIQKNYTIQF